MAGKRNRKASTKNECEEEFKRLYLKASSPACTLADLFTFLEHTEHNAIPISHIPKVFQMYCTKIDDAVFDPLSKLSPELEKRRDFAAAALLGIGRMDHSCGHVPPSQIHTSDTESNLQQKWTNILKWLRHFSFILTNPWFESATERIDAVKVITNFLYFISDYFGVLFHDSMNAEENLLLEIIINVWWRNKDLQFSIPTLTLLYRAFYLLKMDPRDFHSLLLRVTDSNTDAFAKRIVDHINHSMSPEGRLEDVVAEGATSLNIVANFSRFARVISPSTNSKFETSFLKNGVLPHTLSFTIRAIAIRSRARVNGISDRKLQKIFAACFTIVSNALHNCGCLYWVETMLQNEFLTCLANMARFFPRYLSKNNWDFIESIFFGVFPRLTVNSHLIPVFVKAIENLPDAALKHIERSYLKQAWRTFKNVVLERCIFLAFYNRSIIQPKFDQNCFTCHTEEGIQIPLSRCSGCAVALYCSKECQKYGWKKGHREDCGYMKASNEISAKAHSVGKRNFLHRLAMTDVRRHSEVLRIASEILVKDTSTTVTDMVVCVYYDKHPPHLTLAYFKYLVRDLHSEQPRTKATFQEMHDALRPDQMLVYVQHNTGKFGGPDWILFVAPTIFNEPPGLRSPVIYETMQETTQRMAKKYPRTNALVQLEPGGMTPLPFNLDEIDECLSLVRTDYKPGSGESVYSYAESRINARVLLADFVLS